MCSSEEGRGGANTLNWIKENAPNAVSQIQYILDNNPLKWETELMGIAIHKPFGKWLENIGLLAITCGEGDIVIEQLQELGLSRKTRVIIPDISVINKEGKDFEFIWEHIAELESIYAFLADEKSRKVFRNILNFKINHNMELLEEIYDPLERQYFDKDLIYYSSDNIFLDCGSYIGDTIEYYKKWSQNIFSKVYAIEADIENFRILDEKFKSDKRVYPLNIGVWDKLCDISFDNLGSGSGYISEAGKAVIHADKIDSIVGNDRIDFIKMDIEGAEYNALIGARDTIKRVHPRLMISAYHKQDDFIRIPLLIKSLCPDYKIYFRHYRKMSVQETVCYAL